MVKIESHPFGSREGPTNLCSRSSPQTSFLRAADNKWWRRDREYFTHKTATYLDTSWATFFRDGKCKKSRLGNLKDCCRRLFPFSPLFHAGHWARTSHPKFLKHESSNRSIFYLSIRLTCTLGSCIRVIKPGAQPFHYPSASRKAERSQHDTDAQGGWRIRVALRRSPLQLARHPTRQQDSSRPTLGIF